MSDRTGIHPLFTVFAAIALFVCIVGGYVWFNNKPPAAAGEVVSLTAYPIHRELSTGSSLGGMNGGTNIYDQLIVIADIRVRSKSKDPATVFDVWGNLTLADDEVDHCVAANPTDSHKVFVAYPELAPRQKAPMLNGTVLRPGQEIDGQVIFHYPISAQDWNQRKQFNVTVEFQHQNNLVMPVQAGMGQATPAAAAPANANAQPSAPNAQQPAPR